MVNNGYLWLNSPIDSDEWSMDYVYGCFNGGSPSQHGCLNTTSWSNDLDDDWGYPHFRKPAYIYI